MLAGDIVDPFQKRIYDIKGKIPLYFKITFLHIPCASLGVTFNSEAVHGESFSDDKAQSGRANKRNKKLTIKKYKPRSAEIRSIFGSEHSKEAKEYIGKGCTIVGNMRVPIVAGNLAITMTQDAWVDTLNYIMTRSHMSQEAKDAAAKAEGLGKDMEFNATHYLHDVRFGKKRSSAGNGVTANGYVPPLEDRLRSIETLGSAVDEERSQLRYVM